MIDFEKYNKDKTAIERATNIIIALNSRAVENFNKGLIREGNMDLLEADTEAYNLAFYFDNILF